MAEAPGRRSCARIDHATLLAAASRDANGSQAEACRTILAQVVRVVAAVLGPRSPEVPDAAQDAFMRVHGGIGRFVFDPAKPAGPTAWINTIALRTALDHRAGLPRWEQAHEAIASSGEDERGEESADRKVLASALLSQLDEAHRAVLILHFWNGETQEEIAETLGIPLGTVKTRMRTALRRIRELSEERESKLPVSEVGSPRAEPLRGVIAGHREESSWAKKLGALAIAAGVALAIFAGGGRSAREEAPVAAAPVSVNAVEMRADDPQLDDVRFVVTGMLREAAHECGADIAGGMVWFERSGVVSVFDLSGSRVSTRLVDPGCVDRVAKRFRIAASDHSILVQLTPERGGAPAWPAGGDRRGVRLTAWRVDET